jgi:uncharacterized protein involved in exopolysaccharide biosynthesis
MLQNDHSHRQAAYEGDDVGLDPSYYYGILKKRIFYILVPFVLVLVAGSAAAMLWPPTYLSEGKILVESQQIPADLVKPTVTTASKERIQVIEQRVMTRDNLLAILDKYQMFADQRDSLSRTELLDLMRQNTKIKPLELDQATGRTDGLTTIALTVGFTDRRPDVATKVANELITLFLNEDARNRTNRAMETTKFLAREVQRLEGDLAAIDAKIADFKRKYVALGPLPLSDQTLPQLAVLKAELAQKSGVYSKAHPDVLRLKRQIAAIEQMTMPSAATATATAAAAAGSPIDKDALDALQAQRTSIQKNLETAADKLSAAQLGEKLERDQFAERLQVLEQAVMPQKPIKPNRGKILALALLGAVMAGFVGVFAVESLDRTIRGSRDLASVADGHLILAIPYISTRAELGRKKSRIALVLGLFAVALVATLAAAHFFWRPLDELWTILLDRLIAARLLG